MTTTRDDFYLTPEQRDYASTVQQSALALLSIINDVLDFSRIEAGKMVLDPIAFLKEVDGVVAAGLKAEGRLFVSNRAQVILPYHRMVELAAESVVGLAELVLAVQEPAVVAA